MTDFPAGISTFRTRANLPNQVYDPANTTTLYKEDLERIESELQAVESVVLAGGSGVDAPTREIINNSEMLARSIYRVKYGTLTQLGGDGDGTTDITIADDSTLHVSLAELSEDTIFNQLSIYNNNHVTNGDIQVGIYDAYTGNVVFRFEVTIDSANEAWLVSTTEKVLRKGQYITVIRGYGGYEGSIWCRNLGQTMDKINTPTMPHILLNGTITGYSVATLPDNIDLGDVGYTGGCELPIIRLGA